VRGAGIWCIFRRKVQPYGAGQFDPNKLAVLYYFGDLNYWQLPAISADALEHGFDAVSCEDWQGW
jgi:hypothetical protein